MAESEAPTASQPGEPAPPAEQPLAYRAVRGGLWVALGSYFSVAFGFTVNLVLTRLLRPEDFGIFALAGFFFSLFNLRGKVGIGSAFGQRKETTGELLGTHLALDVAAGLVTVAVALGAMPVLRPLGYAPDVVRIVPVLALAGLLETAICTAGIVVEKELHFKPATFLSTGATVLSYVPALWLATHGAGYWSLVAQVVSYSVLTVLGMWRLTWAKVPFVWRMGWRFDPHLAIELLRFGLMVGLGSLTVLFVTQFDSFLIGTFIDARTLGYYERAYRMAQWPNMLFYGLLSRTAFFTYARLQDDAARLSRTLTMTSWLLCIVSLPLVLAVFAAAPDLLALLYGARWMASAPYLRILVVGSLVGPLLTNMATLYTAVGHPRRTTITTAVQAAVYVAVATPLTLRYGATGTCVSLAFSNTAGLAMALWFVRKTVHVSLRDTLGAPVVAGVVTTLAYLALTRGVDLNVLPLAVRVLVKCGFVASLFLGVVYALQPTAMRRRLAQVWRLSRGVRLAE